MDVDVFIRAHRAEWDRLDRLARAAGSRRGLATGEADELVELYQRAATHLSVVQSRFPDAVLVARLSRLVATARAAVVGVPTPAWRAIGQFVAVTFPAAVYRTRWWWAATAAGSLLVMVATGIWVATHPAVQAALLPPATVRSLVQHDFSGYYRAHPALDFAARVWTNNAFVAAEALLTGVLFGVLTILVLLANAVNVGVAAGYLAAAHRLGLFFGLILPHGMLELTAVFVAAGAGLRLGWTVIDPGPRRRADALAEEGRAAGVIALGLVGVLAVSGGIEAFVTPSGLPTWARLSVGFLAEGGFLGYILVLGRRAVAAGSHGDLPPGEGADRAPVAA